MPHDNDTLAKITDRTMLRLIGEEVVMPSKYLEVFTEEEQSCKKPAGGLGQDNVPVPYASAIASLQSYLFADDITGAKNRLWVYKQKLNERLGFQDEGFVIDLRVPEYETIVREYDTNVGTRLQQLVYGYVTEQLTLDHLPFEIARYANGHFLMFLHGTDENGVETVLERLQNGETDSMFKYRNRIFRLTLDAVAVRYIKNEPFASVMDQLEEKRFKKGML